jgi:hypothetical protein
MQQTSITVNIVLDVGPVALVLFVALAGWCLGWIDD